MSADDVTPASDPPPHSPPPGRPPPPPIVWETETSTRVEAPGPNSTTARDASHTERRG
ncbi:hypothetical protein PP568_06910 [Mycobacteroides abscessus]|uniref:Uncharacterized protein n=1 Tax=Mycobacteroides abscessus subsp. abscessus TaxID=1185650 RepID=A0AB38D2P3_9MYCO|nr:hypothetical protein [Mycobacteroides abscessus]MBE5455717.1 hypothetical protein [Mycobacteroides abscessus]MBN7461900.1 hypothetical protein [Mycobacteroides abscessus subsp. abscessus]MBN7555268.1 hypothetical protein [Mycobacteroides abscessus subsp. abscessus]MDM2404661.1 hypothetical protein [Mycobacteroides abscessus]MDM2414379.1 hypothetical protein [Mycobacteroides abscessus]